MLRTAEEFALRRAVDACDRAAIGVSDWVQIIFLVSSQKSHGIRHARFEILDMVGQLTSFRRNDGPCHEGQTFSLCFG
jgi:hypothetical protein